MIKHLIIFLLFGILFFSIFSFAFATNQVEINTASLEQLDKIIGIGPALGQRIIDARPFSSIDDLLRVKGIGEKTLEKIKNQGIAYVKNQALNKENPAPPLKVNNSKTTIGDKKEPEKQDIAEKTKADISQNISSFTPKISIYTHLIALAMAFSSGSVIFALNKSI